MKRNEMLKNIVSIKYNITRDKWLLSPCVTKNVIVYFTIEILNLLSLVKTAGYVTWMKASAYHCSELHLYPAWNSDNFLDVT
jgi:hypothetical protein